MNDSMPQSSSHSGHDPRFDPGRVIRAPRGSRLQCRSWLTEAAPATMVMRHQGRELPVQRIDSGALAQRFGFVPQPRS